MKGSCSCNLKSAPCNLGELTEKRRRGKKLGVSRCFTFQNSKRKLNCKTTLILLSTRQSLIKQNTWQRDEENVRKLGD
jgi:hypothetical protein